MSELYVVVCDKAEWEDISIYTDLSDAKLSLLRSYKKSRMEPLELWIEKFNKSDTDLCFLPSYEKFLINYERVRNLTDNDIDEEYMHEDWFVSYTH